MRTGVIVFPGSNCDRDLLRAFTMLTGNEAQAIWHKETSLPKVDLIGLPGGFSYGDYLRCGAIAARSPIMRAVLQAANAGTPVIGICNGFQLLCETGLLPGALMRNRDLTFICRTVSLRTTGGRDIALPIAHHDGNYQADEATLNALEADGRIALTYCDNPNGSARDIAGVTSGNGRILGLMPHPERASDPAHGNQDGAAFLRNFFEQIPA